MTHLINGDLSNFAPLVQIEIDDAIIPVLFLSHLINPPELQKNQRFALRHDSPSDFHQVVLRNFGDAQNVHDVLRIHQRMVDPDEADLGDKLVDTHFFFRYTRLVVLDYDMLLEIG